MDLFGRARSCRANVYPSSSGPVQQSGGHLGSSRVMNAHEQNLWHVRLGGRSGRHHLFVTDLVRSGCRDLRCFGFGGLDDGRVHPVRNIVGGGDRDVFESRLEETGLVF